MAQKLNPNALRININTIWTSQWYTNFKVSSKWMHQDLIINEYIKRFFSKKKKYLLGQVLIKRVYNKIYLYMPFAVVPSKGFKNKSRKIRKYKKISHIKNKKNIFNWLIKNKMFFNITKSYITNMKYMRKLSVYKVKSINKELKNKIISLELSSDKRKLYMYNNIYSFPYNDDLIAVKKWIVRSPIKKEVSLKKISSHTKKNKRSFLFIKSFKKTLFFRKYLWSFFLRNNRFNLQVRPFKHLALVTSYINTKKIIKNIKKVRYYHPLDEYYIKLFEKLNVNLPLKGKPIKYKNITLYNKIISNQIFQLNQMFQLNKIGLSMSILNNINTFYSRFPIKLLKLNRVRKFQKKGLDLVMLKRTINKVTGLNSKFVIVRLYNFTNDTTIISTYIANQFKRKTSFNSFKYQLLKHFHTNNKILGAFIICKGRLQRKLRKRKQKLLYGRVGRSTFSNAISYKQAEAFTKYGVFGINIWIFYEK